MDTRTMAYPTPPSSQNRANPLAPVAYKPMSTYIPSASKVDRSRSTLHRNHTTLNPNPAEDASVASPIMPHQQHPVPPQPTHQQIPQQQQPMQQHHQAWQPYPGQNGLATNMTLKRPTDHQGQPYPPEPPLTRNTTIRDPLAQRNLAHQMDYQRSLAKISSVNEEDVIDPRRSFQSQHQDGPFMPNDIQQDVASLHIASPQQPSHHETFTLPAQPYHQPQQHLFNEHQQQEPHPYADNNNTGYPQPSPTVSAGSQLYRSSTGSSTLYTQWSQPSSPGFPPSPYSGPVGLYGPGDGFYAQDSHLSEEARNLLDFHPGILSTIAVAFRQQMLENESKRFDSANYGLEFPVTFTGREAVDVVVELTKSDNRRHALAIVRSLEHQLMFFGGGINGALFDSNNDQYFFSESTLAYLPGRSEFPTVPTGVFPLSTPCYSQSCQPGKPQCYSYVCPNRQTTGSVLGRQKSDASTAGSQEKVWANSVSASVYASASPKERNRQEAIFEVINTEHNFVRDLELLEEIFITPLRAGDIVAPEKVEALIEDVFLNFEEILVLNKALLAALRARQEEQPKVEAIGDVLLLHIAGFEAAYTRYIPRIALAEFAYKKEEAQNPRFATFLQDCTRHPEARRLNLRHFVGQPYQRIPRYPLLLSEVAKRTDEGVPDREIVLEVIKLCTELGKRIDACMPEGNRQLRLLKIQDKIIWKSAEVRQDLKLSDRSRKLHFECIVKRRSTLDVQVLEIRLFLFDQLLLMTKDKRDKSGDRESMVHQVSKNPIPLELLYVFPEDGKALPVLNGREAVPGRKLNNSGKSTTSNHRHSTFVPQESHSLSSRVGFQETKYTAPVTIEHRGRRGGVYTLFMTPQDKEEFLEQMEIAQARRHEVVTGSNLFQATVITDMNVNLPPPASLGGLPRNPMDGKRVICSAPYLNVLDGRRRIVIGTEDGVYVGMEDDKGSFRLAIRDISVNQISVLEAYHMLLVLSGKVLKAFNLSCLDPNAEKSLQMGHQLGKSVQFFAAGTCDDKTLVITMKRKSGGESHFMAYEPVENAVLGGHHRGGFNISFGKGAKSEWFKLYKEFYVGTDSSQLLMLSKMICVVCPKGFEILRLSDLSNTEVFPQRKDPDFAFLDQRSSSSPVSMFKINANEFLMCYSDFAFTMTKKGELAKKELIEWEGRPESFAIAYPYIVAFENGLIEVRHIETGALEQIIVGDNIRHLYSNVDIKGNAVIQVHMSDPNRGDMRQVVKLVMAPRTQRQPISYQPRTPYISQQQIGMAPRKSPAMMPRLAIQESASPMSPYTPPTAYNVPPIPQRPSPRVSYQQPLNYPSVAFTNGHVGYPEPSHFAQHQQHQSYQSQQEYHSHQHHHHQQQQPLANVVIAPHPYSSQALFSEYPQVSGVPAYELNQNQNQNQNGFHQPTNSFNGASFP